MCVCVLYLLLCARSSYPLPAPPCWQVVAPRVPAIGPTEVRHRPSPSGAETQLAVPETLRLLTLEELLGLRRELGPGVHGRPPTPGRLDLVRVAAHLAAVACVLYCRVAHGSARNDGLRVAFPLLILLTGGGHFAAAAERETQHGAERATRHHDAPSREPATRLPHLVNQSVPLVDEPLALSSHVTRRLVVATVQCVGLSAATCGANLNTALSGSADEVVLEDGTYNGLTFTIGRDVTLRAQNVGQAVLDGESTRRVLRINSGTVIVEGLNITNGNADNVSARPLNLSTLESDYCQPSRLDVCLPFK